MGRLGSIETGIVGADLYASLYLYAARKMPGGGSLTLAEAVERMDGRGVDVLAPGYRLCTASRDAWGRCLSLQAVKSHRWISEDDWATTLQRFVWIQQRAYKSTGPASEHARRVTHRGRREDLHDYNTFQSRSTLDALRARCCDADIPGLSLRPPPTCINKNCIVFAQLFERQFALAQCRSHPMYHQPGSLIGRLPSANPSADTVPNLVPADALVGKFTLWPPGVSPRQSPLSAH